MNLQFPNNISNKNFKYRRLLIKIYDIKSFQEVGSVLQDKLKQLEDSTKEMVTGGTIKSYAQSVGKIMKKINYLNGKNIANIMLPIPNELQDSVSHNYSTTEGIGSTVLHKIPGVSTAEEVGALAANAVGQQKIMANPAYFQNYKGTEPRDFTFTFKLLPNNKEESENIRDIILALKKYSSPSTDQTGVIMTAPNFFFFSFPDGQLQTLLNLQPCVISSIQTNYTSMGNLDTTMDGNPKYITLTLNIKELRTIEQGDW